MGGHLVWQCCSVNTDLILLLSHWLRLTFAHGNQVLNDIWFIQATKETLTNVCSSLHLFSHHFVSVESKNNNILQYSNKVVDRLASIIER